MKGSLTRNKYKHCKYARDDEMNRSFHFSLLAVGEFLHLFYKKKSFTFCLTRRSLHSQLVKMWINFWIVVRELHIVQKPITKLFLNPLKKRSKDQCSWLQICCRNRDSLHLFWKSTESTKQNSKNMRNVSSDDEWYITGAAPGCFLSQMIQAISKIISSARNRFVQRKPLSKWFWLINLRNRAN